MTFFIETSDKRNQTVKTLLEKEKFSVAQNFDVGLAQKGDLIIFAPNKKFADEEIYALPKQIKLICGNILPGQKKLLRQKKILHINALSDEVFALQNSCLTAEGILANILTETDKSIFESNILILGNGRVGKATSVLFSKLGLRFSVCSHDETNFALAHLFSDKNFFEDEFLEKLSDFDVIINTIPASIIPPDYYSKIKKTCLYLEISSIKTIEDNVDFSYLVCPAIPQKYSAQTAGKYFFECIKRLLK